MSLVLHYKKHEVNQFIDKLIHLHHLYSQNSYELDTKLVEFIEGCQDFYKKAGASNDELVFNELLSYYNTAQKGVNPITFEKLKIGKRLNTQIAAFYCLNEAGDHLKISLAKIEHLLEETTETLSNLLLNVVQTGAMTDEQLLKVDNLEKCEALWNELIKDKQINIIALKFKTKLHLQDIYILLDIIITKMKY